MHRALVVLASVALSASLAGPVAASTGNPATLYIALGDSLAWGDGASVPTHTAYVPRLAGYFHGASHGGADRLVNLAIRGETTASLIQNQLSTAVALINDPATDTRAITISIGGNDLLNLVNDPSDPCIVDMSSATCAGLIGAAMGGVQANLATILGTLQAALATDPGPEKIFVLLLYNPFDIPGNPLAAAGDLLIRGADGAFNCAALANPANIGLDDIVGCTGAAFGAIPVDSYPLFQGRILELTHMGEGFNVHPNDDGYAVIAAAHRDADRGS
jgi:lysophospholipase L1-like esterase